MCRKMEKTIAEIDRAGLRTYSGLCPFNFRSWICLAKA